MKALAGTTVLVVGLGAAAVLTWGPAGFELLTPPPAAEAGGWGLAALLALGTLASEDLACVAGGLLAAGGYLGLLAAILGCCAGIFGTDLAIFLAGRRLAGGRADEKLAAGPPTRWSRGRATLGTARVDRAAGWLRRRGPAVIVASRFLPGTRVATCFAVGLAGLPTRRFAAWQALATVAWTPLLVGAAWWLGGAVLPLLATYQRWAVPVLLAAGVAVWGLVHAVRGTSPAPLEALRRALFTRRGRRLLRGRWRRLRSWEFWPAWAVYLPLLPALAWLALRHRSLTVFTAANPAIPLGGFVGESKADILERLPPAAVARFCRLPGRLPVAERLGAVRAFAVRHGLAPPLVLKPDVGQRGAGVVIARSWTEVETMLATAGGVDYLAQEHVAGPELGLFWARLPDEPRGRLISITEKRLPAVTGDGRSTAEELVLADPRLLARAPLYLERLGQRRHRVLGAGEEVALADLGNHCRGADFFDGERLRTPALEAAVEALGTGCDGFWFGRFDVAAPSLDHFRRGAGLKVLELNGVTSESSHIYDPRYGLPAAWKTLYRQWALAFEVGRRNRRRGARPATVGELVAALRGRVPRVPVPGRNPAAAGGIQGPALTADAGGGPPARNAT